MMNGGGAFVQPVFGGSQGGGVFGGGLSPGGGMSPGASQGATADMSAGMGVPPFADPNRVKDVLIPATLKMLANCVSTEAGMGEKPSMRGQKFDKALVVGQIVKIERPSEIQWLFQVDDGTATMAVQRYAGEEDTATKTMLDSFQLRDYARILVKVGGDHDPANNPLRVEKMDHIQDPNEIPFHKIEAAHTGMRMLKGDSAINGRGAAPAASTDSGAATSAAAAAVPKANLDNQFANASAPAATASTATGDVSMGNGGLSMSKMTGDAPAVKKQKLSMEEAIKEFLKSHGEIGAQRAAVQSACAAHGYSSADVLAALGTMIDDGDIMNTISDDQYAVVE